EVCDKSPQERFCSKIGLFRRERQLDKHPRDVGSTHPARLLAFAPRQQATAERSIPCLSFSPFPPETNRTGSSFPAPPSTWLIASTSPLCASRNTSATPPPPPPPLPPLSFDPPSTLLLLYAVPSPLRSPEWCRRRAQIAPDSSPVTRSSPR
ncbi:unnamed protein product, partial [Ectocarpus sp. 12 AP-2014]